MSHVFVDFYLFIYFMYNLDLGEWFENVIKKYKKQTRAA